ncbi:hypothetical protein BDR04DRAFT_1118346 [Suillus decipiens]|nr:hypothetical protein BDR04DRAFT_1118346 [Suillus decipiens]
MARSGHSTYLTLGRHRAHQRQTQKLMDKEIAELKSYLPEWTSAKRSEKQGVFTAIARAARLFAPKINLGQWKKQKQMYKKAIETVWQEYAQEQFGAGPWNRGRHVKGGWKRIQKLAFELKADGDGMPVLPDITKTKLEEKKAIVRAFLTLHYRLCSGNDKAVIPWSTIIHSQDEFVARTFLLADVDLKEPSKLQNWDMTEAGKCLTFLFKAWKNKDSEMVPSVVSSKSPSPATETIRKQKRVIHQSPEDSSTEAQSDTQETEEEADDDLADGRSPHKRARRAGNPTGAGQKLTVPKSFPKP